MKELNIGCVGYSSGKFNKKLGEALVGIAFKLIEEKYPSDKYTLVSGYTDMGIPAIAYRLADKLGWETVGIACKKAEDNPCYEVDKVIIEGSDWGDESKTFLDYIDVLIRVGGGKQSIAETNTAKECKIPVYEFDLPEFDENDSIKKV